LRVLAFRHGASEGAGRIEAVLAARGIELVYVDWYRDGVGPVDLSSAAGLIFLGGTMSVNDGLPYLLREEEVIQEASASGKPVLGLCLGAQLIAHAMGVPVYLSRAQEIGWCDVSFTQEASADPLFRGAGRRATLFQWHNETFDLPAGATLLGSSEVCVNQAFRLRRMWGMQFHLEVTPEMIAEWCYKSENCGTSGEPDHAIDPAAIDTRELAESVFGAWTVLL
jgi:GMP synthase (glutamine-hydrolysing)